MTPPRVFGLLLVVGLTATAASAQGVQGDQPLDELYVDFVAPDLAAFTLVGVDGSRVSQPANLKALSVALTDGLTPSGGISEQGVGIEITPPLLFGEPTLGDYSGVRNRFSLSFATLRRADTTRVGFGVKWVPFDESDPYDDSNPAAARLQREVGAALYRSLSSTEDYDVLQAQVSARANAFAGDLLSANLLDDAGFERLTGLFEIENTSEPQPASEQEEDVAKLLEGIPLTDEQVTERKNLLIAYADLVQQAKGLDFAPYIAEIEASRKAFRDETWNASSLQFAAGWTARTAGPLDEVRGEGIRGFVGGAIGVGHRLHLQGQLQVRLPVLQSIDDDIGTSIGGRILWGTATERLSIEALHASEDERLGEEGYRVLVGGEFRVWGGTFLEIATGVNLPEDEEARLLTLGGIRYAFRKDRRFDQIPAAE